MKVGFSMKKRSLVIEIIMPFDEEANAWYEHFTTMQQIAFLKGAQDMLKNALLEITEDFKDSTVRARFEEDGIIQLQLKGTKGE